MNSKAAARAAMIDKAVEQPAGYSAELLNSAATSLARYNKEFNFSSRRGIYRVPVDKAWFTCIYNNNPWPDENLRPAETELFRRWLARKGIREVSYGTYPGQGEEAAGYTYVMLIDIDDEDPHYDEMISAYNDIANSKEAQTLAEQMAQTN